MTMTAIVGEAPCPKCGIIGKFETQVVRGRTYVRRTCVTCRRAWQRQNRTKNIDHVRKRDREYRRTYKVKYETENPHKQQNSKPWGRKNPEKFLFNAMQRRLPYKRRKGKSRDIERYRLKMTFEEFVDEIGGKMPTHCPILGIELKITDVPHADCLPTVDRIDERRPYERGNIAIMSWRANVIKSFGTAAEHRKIAVWMEARASRP